MGGLCQYYSFNSSTKQRHLTCPVWFITSGKMKMRSLSSLKWDKLIQTCAKHVECNEINKHHCVNQAYGRTEWTSLMWLQETTSNTELTKQLCLNRLLRPLCFRIFNNELETGREGLLDQLQIKYNFILLRCGIKE